MINYKAFHKMSYGLYIISTESDGKKAGYIGNTAFQVTSEPPRVAISCHKNNASSQKILESGIFSLSVLKKEASTSLIGEFGFMSSEDMDKFSNTETIQASTGAPIVVDSAVAWFDCKVISTHDVGSHTLIIGEVQESEVLSDDDPLTYDYYREKYKMLAPKNAPTYIEKEKLEQGGQEELESPKKPDAEQSGDSSMETHTCTICGFQYNPEEGDPTMGIPPGTAFEDLPEDYKCPICNAGKEYFKKS